MDGQTHTPPCRTPWTVPGSGRRRSRSQPLLYCPQAHIVPSTARLPRTAVPRAAGRQRAAPLPGPAPSPPPSSGKGGGHGVSSVQSLWRGCWRGLAKPVSGGSSGQMSQALEPSPVSPDPTEGAPERLLPSTMPLAEGISECLGQARTGPAYTMLPPSSLPAGIFSTGDFLSLVAFVQWPAANVYSQYSSSSPCRPSMSFEKDLHGSTMTPQTATILHFTWTQLTSFHLMPPCSCTECQNKHFGFTPFLAQHSQSLLFQAEKPWSAESLQAQCPNLWGSGCLPQTFWQYLETFWDDRNRAAQAQFEVQLNLIFREQYTNFSGSPSTWSSSRYMLDFLFLTVTVHGAGATHQNTHDLLSGSSQVRIHTLHAKLATCIRSYTTWRKTVPRCQMFAGQVPLSTVYAHKHKKST